MGRGEVAFPDRFRPLISRLVESRHSVEGVTCQLVHGDMAGNILFHPHLPPAVIDVSPYWRPKRYADAIIVADSIAWAGVGVPALEPFHDPIDLQMMYRAILFRLGAAAIVSNCDDGRLAVEVAAYAPVVRALGIMEPTLCSCEKLANGEEGVNRTPDPHV